MDDNMFFKKVASHFLVGISEMFRNGNWKTIDEALSLESEDGTENIDAIGGDGVRQILAYMAVSKMPSYIIRKHLGELSMFIDFASFIRLMSVRLASVYCAPVDKRMEKLLRINALTPELKYRISKMTIEEINGVLNYLRENFLALNANIGIAIIERIYDGAMIPRESLLFILASCHS